MKPIVLLLVCMSFFSFFSCKTAYQPDAYKKEQMRFGSGGGFTGAVTEYCLLSSGHIFLKEHGDTTFTQINKISKSDAKAIFAEAVEKDIPTYKMKEPYNMYKFIHYMNEEGSNELVWGVDDTSKNGGGEIAGFHSKLMNLINPTE